MYAVGSYRIEGEVKGSEFLECLSVPIVTFGDGSFTTSLLVFNQDVAVLCLEQMKGRQRSFLSRLKCSCTENDVRL